MAAAAVYDGGAKHPHPLMLYAAIGHRGTGGAIMLDLLPPSATGSASLTRKQPVMAGLDPAIFPH